MGGIRLNGYVEEPTLWVDPLGLNGKSDITKLIEEALGSAKDSKGIYRFLDANADIYVGSATDQRFIDRMKQHFRSGKLSLDSISTIEVIEMNKSTTQQIYDAEASEIRRNGGKGYPTSNRASPPNTSHIMNDPNEPNLRSRFDGCS